MNENNNMRSKIKGMLFEFSSEEFQRSVWTTHTWQNKKIVYWPVEFVCMWFDDTFYDLDWLFNNKKLNKKEWEIISAFHEFFKDNRNRFLDEKFIAKSILLLDYEPWQQMQKKAQETLDQLNAIGWEKIDAEI